MNVVSVIDEIPDDHIAQNNMADFSVNENSGRFFDKRFFHSGVFQLFAFRQTDEVFRFEMRVRLLGGNLSADHDRPFSGGELRWFFQAFSGSGGFLQPAHTVYPAVKGQIETA